MNHKGMLERIKKEARDDSKRLLSSSGSKETSEKSCLESLATCKHPNARHKTAAVSVVQTTTRRPQNEANKQQAEKG
jgi:hypothetical protein